MPELAPSPADPSCLDACLLDDETKAPEARKIPAEMMVEAP